MLELAERLDALVVSVDSMQVYRGMDIGTAKPSEEVRARIPHALVDIADPEETVTVALIQRLGRAAITEASEAGRPVVISGGSGLHFRAIVDPLDFIGTDEGAREALQHESLASLQRRLLRADSEAGEHVDLANRRRVERALEVVAITGQGPSVRAASLEAQQVRQYRSIYDLKVVGLDPGADLQERIEARLDSMLEAGLADEVAGLRHRLGPTASQAVGYKELIPVVDGNLPLAQGRDDAIRATMGLAKRQRTWFRRDPRVVWLEWHADPAVRSARVEREVADWIS